MTVWFWGSGIGSTRTFLTLPRVLHVNSRLFKVGMCMSVNTENKDLPPVMRQSYCGFRFGGQVARQTLLSLNAIVVAKLPRAKT